MGALYNGTCYAEAAQAQAVHLSSLATSWGEGADWHTVEPTENMGVLCHRLNGGPCQTMTVTPPAFPECEYVGGVSFAVDWLYLVLPAVVVLWGIRKVVSMFDQDGARA